MESILISQHITSFCHIEVLKLLSSRKIRISRFKTVLVALMHEKYLEQKKWYEIIPGSHMNIIAPN